MTGSRRQLRTSSSAQRPGEPAVLVPTVAVAFSSNLADRGPFVTLKNDYLVASCNKGYSSVRSSHAVGTYGDWFVEFEIPVDLKNGAHVRVGWCTSKADMQRSIGADEHGYAFRDVNGAKVHNGKRDHYGAAFGPGCIVGCLLSIPQPRRAKGTRKRAAATSTEALASTVLAGAGVTDEGAGAGAGAGGGAGAGAGASGTGAGAGAGGDSSSGPWEGEAGAGMDGEGGEGGGSGLGAPPAPAGVGSSTGAGAAGASAGAGSGAGNPGSGHPAPAEDAGEETLGVIRFFINGEDQGVAFAGVKPGRYFAGASMYMGASVKINPGPEFKHPPDGYSLGLVRPLSLVPSLPPDVVP